MIGKEEWSNITEATTDVAIWSENTANEEILGARAALVRKKIRASKVRWNKLKRASNENPTLGIYGPSQAGKSYLTSKLAANNDGVLKINLKKDYDFLQDINPAGGRESTAVVSRFSSNKQNQDMDFPVSTKLLDEGDIVCILANSFKKDIRDSSYPSAELITERMNGINLSTELQQNSVTLDRVLEMENYLDKHVFDKESRERFSEVWKYLNENVEYLSTIERRKLFSLFWNDLNDFSSLFSVLSDELNAVEDVKNLNLEVGALIPRECSIIDVDVMKRGYETREKVDSISAKDSAGNQYKISRWALSALTEELYLPVREVGLDFFTSADILDFPGARSRIKTFISSQDGSEAGLLIELFLRGKVDYLFQKFIEEQAVDALALCIDPDPMEVADLPPLIAEWVGLNNGKTPEERKATSNSLFFIMTKFDIHLVDKPGSGDDDTVRFSNAVESALIQPFDKSKKSFVSDWDGRPFSNTFPIRNPKIKSEGIYLYEDGKEVQFLTEKNERINQLRTGFLNSASIERHLSNASEKWNSFIKPGDGGVGHLVKAMQEFDFPLNKRVKLGMQVRSNLKSLYDLLSVFEVSDNNQIRIDEERSHFAKLWPELEKICQTEKFASFLSLFLMSEDLAKASIMNVPKNIFIVQDVEQLDIPSEPFMPSFLKAGDKKSLEPEPSSNGISKGEKLKRLTKTEFYADAVLNAWENNLSDLSSNSVRANKMGFSMDLMSFVSKHIAFPSNIEKLKAKIDHQTSKSGFILGMEDNVSAIAKLACETINEYIVCLSTADNQSKTNKDLKPVEAKETSKFETQIPNPFWLSWTENFGTLIEANITDGSDLKFDPQQNLILSGVLRSFKEAEDFLSNEGYGGNYND